MKGTVLSVSTETPDAFDKEGYEALGYAEVGTVDLDADGLEDIKQCPCGGTLINVSRVSDHDKEAPWRRVIEKIQCEKCRRAVSGKGGNLISRWNSEGYDNLQ